MKIAIVLNKRKYTETFIKSTAGHTYQSWEYGEAKKIDGWNPERYIYRINNVEGCIQILSKTILGVKLGYLQYGPDGLQLLDQDELAVFIKKFEETVNKNDFTALFLQEPLTPNMQNIYPRISTSTVNIAYINTIILDLSKSQESILSECSKTTRYEIKRSIKEDKLTITFEDGTDALDKFLTLAKLSSQRSGGSYPSREYYEAISMENNLQYFFSYYEDKIISAIGAYISSNMIVYQWAAMTNDTKYTKLYSQKRLIFEMIIWAKKKNIKYLDLGGVSKDPIKGSKKEGIKKFKSSFGGVEVNSMGTIVISKNNRISKVLLFTYSKLRSFSVKVNNKMKSLFH